MQKRCCFLKNRWPGVMLLAWCLVASHGDAEPVFVPQAPVSTGVASPSALAVADLDGDGHVDVVVSNESTDSVAVFRNAGNGTLTAAGAPIAVGDRPFHVLLVDLDGDGKHDLVTADRGSGTITVLPNASTNGSIVFDELAIQTVTVLDGPFFVTAANFDQDAGGRPDLAVTNLEDHSVAILIQQSDGSFVTQTALQPSECCLFANDLAQGDVNGDGVSDLVVANVGRPAAGADRLHVWLNSGTSTPFDESQGPLAGDALNFPEAVDDACDFAGTEQEDCHRFAVRLADVNADNVSDLVIANEFTGTVSVLVNNGNPAGLAFTRVDISGGHNAPVALAVADLDDDGDTDVVVVNKGSNDVSILLNHGNGAFAPPQNFPVGLHPVAVAVADINGDGYRDLLVANQGAHTVSVLLGRPLYPTVMAAGDFNGDGWADLAIGSPGETVSGHAEAGAVHILYGSASGLVTTGAQWFHQDSPGVANSAGDFDRFGSALATGDLNGDGFIDLAIGAPGESIGVLRDAGLVHVLYGSASGLSATGSQVFHQNTAGLVGSAAAFDQFGKALAIGNFNGDAYRDLAIGIPGKAVSGASNAGAVQILYGSAAGLSNAGNQLFHQNSAELLSNAVAFDRFGSALAVGNFNGDAYRDLAIGVPGKRISGAPQAGAVHILYGAAAGLTATGNQLFHQNGSGILSTAAAFDRFGSALAVGDFDADTFVDLAVGVPGKTVEAQTHAGMVHVFYGTGAGLGVAENRIFHQHSANIAGVPTPYDYFGGALAAGNINGDAFVDLVIGVPGEAIHARSQAGMIHVLYGTAAGLATTGSQAFHQDSSGMVNVAEPFERFGWAVRTGDFNNDGLNDVVVGVPREDGAATSAGAVHVLDGSASGPSSTGDQVFHLRNTGAVTVEE